MRCDSGGVDMCSRAAARPKWHSSATATKYRRRRRSTPFATSRNVIERDMIRVGFGRGRRVVEPAIMSSMKMMWFHLMPYPDLPEDFNKRHRSVWVDIDPALFDRDR